MTIGYFASSFDMLNVRDLDLIAQARALCTRLVLGVYTDDFAEDHYGRRPVVPQHERIALLQHVRGVDEVREHDDETFASVVVDDGEPLIFTVVDENVVVAVGATVELRPGRETASRILRDALAPSRSSAVA